jgi:hypothetical protein
MRPVYERLNAILGPDGALFAYSDDVYLVSDSTNMSIALAVVPVIYKKVGLRIGLGPGKTEIIFPPGCDQENLLRQLDRREELPKIISDFIGCLGVPHHAKNDQDFIVASLESLGVRHDHLIDLAEMVADEGPFGAYGSYKSAGSNASGTLSAQPHLPWSSSSLNHATMQLLQPLRRSSINPLYKILHILCRWGAGGTSLTSLARHAASNYNGAFFRVAGLLHMRLIAMGGCTSRVVASLLAKHGKACGTQ